MSLVLAKSVLLTKSWMDGQRSHVGWRGRLAQIAVAAEDVRVVGQMDRGWDLMFAGLHCQQTTSCLNFLLHRRSADLFLTFLRSSMCQLGSMLVSISTAQ